MFFSNIYVVGQGDQRQVYQENPYYSPIFPSLGQESPPPPLPTHTHAHTYTHTQTHTHTHACTHRHTHTHVQDGAEWSVAGDRSDKN